MLWCSIKKKKEIGKKKLSRSVYSNFCSDGLLANVA